jgi:hypothetical protein
LYLGDRSERRETCGVPETSRRERRQKGFADARLLAIAELALVPEERPAPARKAVTKKAAATKC